MSASWLARLLDLLYPQRCGGCGGFGDGLWCGKCNARVKRLKREEAARESLLSAGAYSIQILSAAIYEPPLREAIHAFKYNETPHLADLFSEWMSETWRSSRLDASCCAPVPLHTSRLRERGFNQSEWLSERFSKRTKLAHKPRALQRIRRTDQQALLEPDQRRQNVKDAFIADATQVKDMKIVLIDDVLTTGATMSECARVLLEAGASEVFALTLTRTAR
jgi:ComF family protein